MSKATAQPITVTIGTTVGDQEVKIFPAAQVQQAQIVGVSLVGDQTVEIAPAS